MKTSFIKKFKLGQYRSFGYLYVIYIYQLELQHRQITIRYVGKNIFCCSATDTHIHALETSNIKLGEKHISRLML